MTQFKVGQKWRTRGGDIRKIEEIRDGRYSDGYGLYLDDKTHRYFDGSYYDGGADHGDDLVFLIEDVPEDVLHPCLERVEKLTIKEGEYGRFFVGKRHSGSVCVWVENSGCPLTEEDFAEAAGLFTALAKATGEPT